MARARAVLGLTGFVATAGVLLYGVATLPPRPGIALDAGWRPRTEATVRGAYHIHTSRSDGTGSLDDIAAAAARAGLDFVILTDHGDGTRAHDPPAYRQGVLCVDAVEISTTGGHYVALGLPPAPYPLAGDPAAVVEDVRRLGGLGIAAHPDSRKRSLAWRDWDPPVDGIEWLNADSEWRDESRGALARSVLHYLVRGPETLAALFDDADVTLRRWDEAGSRGRRWIALAGTDAHARLGPRGTPDDLEGTGVEETISLPVPSYEAVFRAFSTRVELDAPLGGDPAADAARLIHAIRNGRTYTAIDGFAAGGGLEFTAETSNGPARMGDNLAPGVRPLRFSVRTAAPAGAEIRLIENGRIVARSTGVALGYEVPDPGADRPRIYRPEVRLPGGHAQARVPWIVGNAIYVGAPAHEREARAGEPAVVSGVQGPLPGAGAADAVALYAGGDAAGWTVERDDDSVGAVDSFQQAAGRALAFRFGLADGKANAFVALAHDLQPPIGDDRAVLLRARASRPLRLSVQLRLGDPVEDLRWRWSVYLDADPRELAIHVRSMRGVARDVAEARRRDANGLLLVIDRTNTAGGATGIVWIDAVHVVTLAAADHVRTVSSR